jgi:hypothetical protein
MMRQPISDRGAVTAEFVVVLPAVLMILAISIGSLTAQLERLKLVSIAGMIARAVARDEPPEMVNSIFARQIEGRELKFFSRELMACVELSRTVNLAGLANFGLRLAETQCARKLGL